MLLCLLLVSKGWCITRNTLQRREVCLAGCNLALLYAAVSIQLSVRLRTPCHALRRAMPCAVPAYPVHPPHKPPQPPTTPHSHNPPQPPTTPHPPA